MNAWKPKKTFVEIVKDVACLIAIAAMWMGTWMMIFAFA